MPNPSPSPAPSVPVGPPAGDPPTLAKGRPTGLLTRVRVLDLTRILSGPWCTQLLGDLGADVIKVERPGIGDEAREHGRAADGPDGRPTGERANFLATNRSKRSVVIDIAKPAGQDLIRRLVADCDVLVENFKTGDLKRYGLDAQTLCALNPRLVYCSITGFGQTGPYAPLPGYDVLFQAMSGVMSVTGVPDGQPGAGPQRVGFQVSDITAGLYATIGILAALQQRDTVTGRGQHIDLALLDAQIATTAAAAQSHLVGGPVPQRVGSGSTAVAPYGTFDAADGQLMLAVANDKQFRALCQVIGRPQWPAEPALASTPARAAHQAELAERLNAVLRTRTVAEWMPALREAGVPAGPILDMHQVFDDPQVRHRGLLHTVTHPVIGALPLIGNPLKFSAAPMPSVRPPPTLGQHTAEVLRERLQLDDATLAALAAQGVIG